MGEGAGYTGWWDGMWFANAVSCWMDGLISMDSFYQQTALFTCSSFALISVDLPVDDGRMNCWMD